MRIDKALLISALVLSLAGTALAQDIRTGLVAYWPLDVDNSGLTPDLTGFGNDLTEFNGPTLGPGKKNNGFTLNGSSQYLDLTQNATDFNVRGLPIYSSPIGYTVAMWVNGIGPGGARYIFAEGSTTSGNPLLIMQTGNSAAVSNKLDIIVRNDAGTVLINHFVSSHVVFDSTWHHIAIVDNRSAIQVYVDGLTDTNLPYATSGTFSFNTTAFGALVRAAVAGYFNGQIDDIAVWERTLTQNEIQNVMSNSISLPIPPAVPVVFRAPVSRTNAMGDRAVFSVGAVGARPLVYQWSRDGSVLDGQTNATLVLTALNSPTTNLYTVVTANSLGRVTNSATLVVRPDAAPNLSSNLVSYWPLNVVTNSGTTNTPDLYSHNDLLLNNMDAGNLVPGQFGNALSFNTNGVSQYANRQSGFPTYNTNSYSVSLWVQGVGLGQSDTRVFSEGSVASANPLFSIGTDNLAGGSGFVNLYLRNDGNTVLVNSRKSTRTAFDGNWHHLVWLDEAGQAKLYVDGVLDETDFSYTVAGTFTLNATAIGAVLRATASNFYLGNIDEVAVWNRRLNYTEIQQIYTTGVPVPVAATPVSITVQPADQTNGVYSGDTVSLSVQAVGTGPLSYQWWRNGTKVSPASNPSAVSNTLTFASAQASDSANYWVVITNVANAVTSSVVQLLVLPYTPTTNGVALLADFDSIGSPNVQPGFLPMTLLTSGSSLGGVRVSVSQLGGITLADRLRNPSAVTNSPPLMNQAQIYNDFIFGSSTAAGTGLRVLIEKLATNTAYGLTVWSYDSQSTGARISDWTETSSGNPVPIMNGYLFNGSNLPARDYDFTFGALLTSSADGKLQIEGLNEGGSLGVFVNAIRLVANPSLQFTSAIHTNGVFGDNVLQVKVEAQYPGQSVAFEERDALAGATWGPITSGGVTETHGPIITAEFPILSTQKFYRAVSQ